MKVGDQTKHWQYKKKPKRRVINISHLKYGKGYKGFEVWETATREWWHNRKPWRRWLLCGLHQVPNRREMCLSTVCKQCGLDVSTIVTQMGGLEAGGLHVDVFLPFSSGNRCLNSASVRLRCKQDFAWNLDGIWVTVHHALNLNATVPVARFTAFKIPYLPHLKHVLNLTRQTLAPPMIVSIAGLTKRIFSYQLTNLCLLLTTLQIFEGRCSRPRVFLCSYDKIHWDVDIVQGYTRGGGGGGVK